jgi:hypothetical protein
MRSGETEVQFEIASEKNMERADAMSERFTTPRS